MPHEAEQRVDHHRELAACDDVRDFGVEEIIGRDQVTDYARRRGEDALAIEARLRPWLGYES